MSSHKNNTEDNDANDDMDSKPQVEDAQVNKQAAVDLEKMTDFHEEKDEMNEVSKESLGNLKAQQPEQKKFTVRKEDIQYIVQELEVPRIVAERKLMQHEGNLRAAIIDMIGFNE